MSASKAHISKIDMYLLMIVAAPLSLFSWILFSKISAFELCYHQPSTDTFSPSHFCIVIIRHTVPHWHIIRLSTDVIWMHFMFGTFLYIDTWVINITVLSLLLWQLNYGNTCWTSTNKNYHRYLHNEND